MASSFFQKFFKKTEQINKKPQKISEIIAKNNMTEMQKKDLERLVESIESAGLDEFMEYIRSPWRMLWPNFVAGVARGIGALIGAALVIAIIGWILTQMISLPLIGKELEPYVSKVQAEITRYTESTNYNDNFENMEKTLLEIRDEIKRQNNILSR